MNEATILVRDGKVVAAGPAASVSVPDGAERVDLKGKTVIPGLINTHGHVTDTKGLESGPQFHTVDNILRQLGLYARYGVTTVFSLGGDSEYGFKIRDQQDDPSLTRARLIPAGPPVRTGNPAAARLMTDAIADMKSTLLKIRVDDELGTVPKMPPMVYQSVIEQAHRRKLRVAAHIYSLEDAKAVVKAGADFIAHSVRDQAVDEEFITLLKDHKVCYCPTLMRDVSTYVYETAPDFFKDPFFLKEADPDVVKALQDPAKQQEYRDSESAQKYKEAHKVAVANVKRLVDAGVTIAMGTDSGPPARFQGYFEHLELELLVKAGLTPAQALRAATGDAARCMGLEGTVGTLAPGAWADFVVLDADPLADITNTRRIDSVWIAGNRVLPGHGVR